MVAMTPWMAALLLVGGMVMLGAGSSWLVTGASRLALGLGVSPMIVGLTVVGFGTSMPELSVSVLAAMRGSGGLSLGNAVGSNIMNLLVVLGAAAVVAPLHVLGNRKALRSNLVFGLVPAVILIAGGWSGRLSRPVALALLLVFAIFLGSCIRSARGSEEGVAVKRGNPWLHLALLSFGIAVLVTGAHLMVQGGVSLAHQVGVSDAVIGLTVVAFGTSLPELATSVTAALRGEAELSVGNVLGSNVFNLGLVVGSAFSIHPERIPAFVARQDIPILIGVTLFVGLIVLPNGKISRKEGALMLLIFAAYMAFLVLRAM
ncbi:MAG: calcium/sodium antiporter [Acidobacteria bacterium]|nr:calcium/sodium antiporter [Acidobacteriota bacterium]